MKERTELLHRPLDIRQLPFDVKLGRMDTDHHETAVFVLLAQALIYGMARMQLMQE